jgi:hypothetical protein
VTFNLTDNAPYLDAGLNIHHINHTPSDGIGLPDTTNQSLSGSYSYPIPHKNHLSGDVDIPPSYNRDYLGNTALLPSVFNESYAQKTPTNSDGFSAVPSSNSSSVANQSVDDFGVPTNNYPSSSNQSFSSSQSSNTAVNDWVSKNLLDQQIITQTKNLAADGQLSRNDIIAIFRDAEDDSVIDATEYKDLQTIVNNSSYFHMEDYVRVLSSKVVFGTTANANYQGKPLGNLYAGSSSSQMEKLIGKWFLGSDRPSTPYTYQLAEGSLFQDGASYKDVSQGLVGDCYFLAGLAETAIHSPSTIQGDQTHPGMFIDNGDQTYTVRFYNNGIADYVTVDKYLPVDSVNDLIYANQPGSKWGKYYDKTNELWVALAEKAYAQINESGWIGQDNTNSYAGISGGWDTDSFRQITGTNASSSKNFDLNSIVNAYNTGTLLGISSKSEGIIDSIVPGHVYVVTNYNPSTQLFTLFNPWGVDGGLLNGKLLPGFLTVSINELSANFSQWSYKS